MKSLNFFFKVHFLYIIYFIIFKRRNKIIRSNEDRTNKKDLEIDDFLKKIQIIMSIKTVLKSKFI